ncbi:PREDICTED: uncharacterized protein LOC102007913 [Chinchilla lanigera]|uniref:uncharacterized protein LOC102007913 n=1 Tax=Chinchilla lanigera TaxID=34839 RepID=UPI00038EE53A|nr:PREDICTED: uncharacterized protein LOC102007913 [Chinchilla lanigera]
MVLPVRKAIPGGRAAGVLRALGSGGRRGHVTARDVRAAASRPNSSWSGNCQQRGEGRATPRRLRAPRALARHEWTGHGQEGPSASAGPCAVCAPHPFPPGRGRAEDSQVPSRARGDKLTSLFCLSFQLQRTRAARGVPSLRRVRLSRVTCDVRPPASPASPPGPAASPHGFLDICVFCARSSQHHLGFPKSAGDPRTQLGDQDARPDPLGQHQRRLFPPSTLSRAHQISKNSSCLPWARRLQTHLDFLGRNPLELRAGRPSLPLQRFWLPLAKHQVQARSEEKEKQLKFANFKTLFV